jgi:predicted acetyltransferase
VERRSTDAASQRYDIAEFFVLRRYRRRGVGRRAASLLWQRLPGQWTVRVAEDNHNGLAFWRPVIASFANGLVTESMSVQDQRDWRTFAFESLPLSTESPHSAPDAE